jgi:acyl carrier protein
VSPNEINELTSPENMQVWDSLKFMQLVAEFEAEYNVTLDIEQITNLNSFLDFRNLLEEMNVIE